MSTKEYTQRLAGLISNRGKIDILMISGGEPTAHPELISFLEIANNNSAIGRVMLNTNGVLVAQRPDLRDALLKKRKKLEIYLQFDSLEDSTQQKLRAQAGLLEKKKVALSWLEENSVPTTLAASLAKGITSEEIGALIKLALSQNCIRGISFQPVFASGRHELDYDPNNRLTTPDVVTLICNAAPEHFKRSSFINLPCSHPNCAIVGYFYKASGRIWPICDELTPEASLNDRINFNLEDLRKCGCDTTELGGYIRSAELSSENSFRIVIKPFMDRFSLNRDRSSQCCTHVIGPNGKAMSFCEYNIFRKQMDWNRNAD